MGPGVERKLLTNRANASVPYSKLIDPLISIVEE